MRLAVMDALQAVREQGLKKILPDKPRLGVGLGTCGEGNGGHEIFQGLADNLENLGVDAHLATVGCLGYCAQEPLVNLWVPGQPMLILNRVTAADTEEIAQALAYGKLPTRRALCKISRWDHLTGVLEYGSGLDEVPEWNQIPFWAGQKKTVLRNCGLINPEDIEEYIAVGGYFTIYDVLKNRTPDQVIDEVKKARLRGRGGAGFPTGNKWEMLKKAPGERKFIICNADEGDPGAYMNRNEIESDPHALIEGMMICGYAVGATQGVVYVRAEYPLAVMRLKRAIEQARGMGLLGSEILGTSFKFDLNLVEGAGAFVCGEETSLIASLEDRSGRPRPRPPFPAQKGLEGAPTNINNVETWYNIVPILAKGGEWFSGTGVSTSPGTKVFSLVGKVKNTGLVEMPLGSALKQIIYDIGGGTGTSKKVKAVQTGGPSGGCIPAELFNSSVDYESLAALGAIMGSGGMVVMDEDNCMVDVARYFIEFSHSESCGQCVPCRVGLDHALRILKLVTSGEAREEDLATLESLAQMIKETSLCGLGQTAPNPVLTTLKYFRREYLEHVQERRCLPTACEALFVSPCENTCPVHMNIPGYLQLVNEGRLEEAALAVLMDNPLPASTGRVCQHPCESRCRRGDVDEPVAIRDMHRFVVDQAFRPENYSQIVEQVAGRQAKDTGRKVAIAGAGPAGLAAAFYLRLLGHQVTVYEARGQAGGMLRYALPEYRLPESVLDREIGLIQKLGVEFVFNWRLGRDKTLAQLQQNFDAVLLALGTWKEVALGIPGADLRGVMTSLELLEAVATHETAPVGKRVVVIGGGNSAIDSARTAVRLGSQVTVAYRRGRSDMPAIAEETEAAEAEGVEFHFLAVPKSILGSRDGGVTALEVSKARLGPFDLFGRRTPQVTEEVETILCDTIVVAAGEKVDGDLVRQLELELGPGDKVAVNPLTMETGHPGAGVYAAGDVVHGPANVVMAMGSGKRAAAAIDRDLMGSPRLSRLRPEINYQERVPLVPMGGGRHHGGQVAVPERRNHFVEVTVGLSPEDARVEATRCLRCDVKASPAKSEAAKLAPVVQEAVR